MQKDGRAVEGQFALYLGNGAIAIHVPLAFKDPFVRIHVRRADRGRTWAYNRGREAQAFRTVAALTDVEERA